MMWTKWTKCHKRLSDSALKWSTWPRPSGPEVDHRPEKWTKSRAIGHGQLGRGRRLRAFRARRQIEIPRCRSAQPWKTPSWMNLSPVAWTAGRGAGLELRAPLVDGALRRTRRACPSSSDWDKRTSASAARERAAGRRKGVDAFEPVLDQTRSHTGRGSPPRPNRRDL